MANILYRKQKQQISYDGGATWNDTGEYRVGSVLENPSNCTSSDSKQCRWVELDASEGYYCDSTTFTKYSLKVEECSENGLIWTRTGNQEKGDTILGENSFDCGYVMYRWVDTSEEVCLQECFTYQIPSTYTYCLQVGYFDNHFYYVCYKHGGGTICVIDIDTNNLEVNEYEYKFSNDGYSSSIGVFTCDLNTKHINSNGVFLINYKIQSSSSSSRTTHFLVSFNVTTKDFYLLEAINNDATTGTNNLNENITMHYSPDDEHFLYVVTDSTYTLYRTEDGVNTVVLEEGDSLNNANTTKYYETKSFGKYCHDYLLIYSDRNETYGNAICSFKGYDYKGNMIGCQYTDDNGFKLYIFTKNEYVIIEKEYLEEFKWIINTENKSFLIFDYSTYDDSSVRNVIEFTYSDINNVNLSVAYSSEYGYNSNYEPPILYKNQIISKPYYNCVNTSSTNIATTTNSLVGDNYISIVADSIYLSIKEDVYQTAEEVYDIGTNTHTYFSASDKYIKKGNYPYNILEDEDGNTKIGGIYNKYDLDNDPYFVLEYEDDYDVGLNDNECSLASGATYLYYKEPCTNTLRAYTPDEINAYYFTNGFVSITFPSNITSFDYAYESTFNNCKQIVFQSSTPPSDLSFAQCSVENMTVIIPKDANEATFRSNLNMPSEWVIINSNE